MTDEKLAGVIWDYMRFEQPLEKADIIIGLGSTDVRTAEWCAKLWHDGLAPKILFTGDRGKLTRDVFTESEAEVYARRAIELGVPDDVILRESTATNTGENIVRSHALLKREGIKRSKIILEALHAKASVCDISSAVARR